MEREGLSPTITTKCPTVLTLRYANVLNPISLPYQKPASL
jgi:hypothetical protein